MALNTFLRWSGLFANDAMLVAVLSTACCVKTLITLTQLDHNQDKVLLITVCAILMFDRSDESAQNFR